MRVPGRLRTPQRPPGVRASLSPAERVVDGLLAALVVLVTPVAWLDALVREAEGGPSDTSAGPRLG